MNIKENGFELIRNFADKVHIDEIIEEVSSYDQSMPKYGIRNAEKKFSSISSFIDSDLVQDKATEILGSKPDLVRAIFFDKTLTTNWLVTWHQDKTISVNTKTNISGWGPWSIKDGINHVQPCIDVLNQMVTFRLHLDSTDETNGCLKVIPNSHLKGLIPQEDILKITKAENSYACIADAGDIVMMRPHLLHASSKCKPSFSGHRRIVHLEFSNYNLPKGIHWA